MIKAKQKSTRCSIAAPSGLVEALSWFPTMQMRCHCGSGNPARAGRALGVLKSSD